MEPKHFAYIVDGEVAHIQSLHPDIHESYERLYAVFSSSPTIIEINQSIGLGYVYNSESGSFSEPE